MLLEMFNQNKCFGGLHQQFSHRSDVTNCTMRFAVFLPPEYKTKNPPVLYWLSGLTCTEENFMQKAGAFKKAAELGLVIVAPDTSPRGDEVPDDPDKAYDLGHGAGFYVNATQDPWKQHYQMYDYVLHELPEIINKHFHFQPKQAICGHSMGGHGAIILALRNPDKFASASAFSPICHPTQVPWGQKAFSHYLGDDKAHWAEYDATILIQNLNGQSRPVPILVDQGDDDQFLETQLRPQSLQLAAKEKNYPLTLRYQHGYDHSYYFISTFIDDHLDFHWQYLQQ
ncbi:S-formylglutathione hydrolase [Facilibium subflavum]|uniref:S-formylglutathione hydrolase n=1 Tax=Facilibium subflavum TaxID=2219058 RepID=UPI000E6467D5|nr:S-formylglutathione hydrolase [Facilibium subflavum]